MSSKISVIIPTYCSQDRHDWGRLYLSLVGFANQTLSSNLFEIIVVNDGSHWDIASLVDTWRLADNINVITQPHQGIGTAIKTGVQASRYEYLLLGVDDNIPCPMLLASHLSIIDKHPNCVSWGREYHMRQMKPVFNPLLNPSVIDKDSEEHKENNLRITQEDILYSYDKLITNSLLTPVYQDIERTLKAISTHCTLRALWLVMRLGNQVLSREFYEKVGGIDSNFNPSGWYMDLELGLRLLMNHAQFVLNEEAVMVHLSHYREAVAREDEAKKHQYFYKKHPLLEVLLLPLFFNASLSIKKYGAYLARFETMMKG